MRQVLVIILLIGLASSAAAQVEDRPTARTELETLAESRYAEGDLGAARRLYLELAAGSQDPSEQGRVLLLAAWLAHLAESYPEARNDLLRALAVDPDLEFRSELYNSSFVSIYRAALDQARGRRAGQARTLLEEGVAALDGDNLEAARRAFEEVLERVPSDATATYNLALVEQRSGNTTAALAGFEKVLAIAHGNPESVRIQLRVKALTNLGLLFQDQGSSEDAVLYLEQALSLDSTDARAWNNLGLAHRELGRKEQAAEAFRRAFELSPEDLTAVVNLSIAHIELRQWSEAVAILMRTAAIHPESPSLWLHLGLAHRGGGELEPAASALQKVLDLDPNNEQGMASRAASDLALVLLQRGDAAGARQAARRALAWREDDLASLRILGLSHSRLGELEAAKDTLEEALRRDPEDAETANNLGTVYFSLRSWSRAEQLFARALELRPDFAAARENLAKARAKPQQPSQTQPVQSESRPREKVPLGVRFAEVDYGSLGIEGALVDSVFPDTPAARAGLRKGDLLFKVDGQTIENAQDVHKHILRAQGKRVVLELLRDGRPLRVEIRLR